MKQEELNELLEEIRPKSKEQILRRIRHKSFAKIIIWSCITSKECDFVDVKELAKYMRISLQRSRCILEDMVKFELLKRNKLSGCNVDYYFNLDEFGRPLIFKYFELCREVLGIKLKTTLNLKEEIKETKNI